MWPFIFLALLLAWLWLRPRVREGFGTGAPMQDKLKNMFLYLKLRADRTAPGAWDVKDEQCAQTLRDLTSSTSQSDSSNVKVYLTSLGLSVAPDGSDYEQVRMQWLAGLSAECINIVRDLTGMASTP